MFGYGTEGFSPIRTETSLNESPYNSRRDSGGVSEYLTGQSPLDVENIGNIMCQNRNNMLENVTARNKMNGSKEQMVFNMHKIREENKHMATIQKDFMAPFNYDESLFGNSFEKDFAMEVDLPENKLSFVTKRGRSSSQSGKELQEMIYCPKITNPTLKGKQAKHHYTEGLQNYVPIRSETHRSRDLPVVCDKLNLNRSQSDNNLLICVEKKPVEVIDLEVDACDSNLNKNETSPIAVNNTTQNYAEIADLNCINATVPATIKRSTYECSIKDINTSMPGTQSYSTQSQPIQANIMEKLIKDTVSFEFDAIRQLLYLQHMSLLRHLHKTLEVFENQNSSNCEFMLRVIEELMQENRQLRNAVIAHQRRT